MWMILKTFELSKNLVHLFYLILIINTVSNRHVEEPAYPTDIKIDHAAEGTNPIPSNIEKGSTVNNGTGGTNNGLKGIIERLNNLKNIPPTRDDEKINSMDLKENGISSADIKIEDQDVEEDPFKDIKIGLSSDLKTPGDVPGGIDTKDKTNSKKNKKKKKNKQISEIVGEQVVNDNDSETGAESNTIVGTSDTVKSTIEQISDPEENPTKDIQGVPQNQNPDIGDELNTIVETDDTIKSKITQISDPEKDPIENTQDDTPQKLEEINTENLEISSLEKIEIIKIKRNPSNESEVLRKKNKRAEFQEFAPQKSEARIYCTFLGNVLKMYNKVKQRFVGHFCHAIVIGTPIILQQQRVHLTQKMKGQLNDLKLLQKESLVVVIMEYRSYTFWKQELLKKDMKRLILEIISMVARYKIDGIQFSNLHPIQEGAEMMDKLISFFKDLQTTAKTQKYDLKIGINIDFNDLSIVKSFTSLKDLNTLVTWYSFKSISMVTCSSKYKDTGTSPNMSFNSTITTLIKNINDNNEFDMRKLVVGIQLFPNKVNETHPYTYEEFCSVEKSTWHKSWCAASPQDLRSKGGLLRSSQIGGFQLYYMHSDDYRSTCGCHSFPLIRSFLRGLIKSSTKEICDFKTAHN